MELQGATGRGRVAPLLAAVIASLALIPGCGGGSSGTATSGSSDHALAKTQNSPDGPLSKTQLLRRGNDVCKRALDEKERQIADAAKQNGKSLFAASTKELEAMAEEVLLPVYEEALSELHSLKLTRKSGDGGEYNHVLHEYDAALKEVQSQPRIFIKSNPFAKGDEAARAFGLKGCAL